MADVTATFAAKDQGVAAMIQRLENKLSGFQTRMGAVSASAKRMQGAFTGLGRSIVGIGSAYIGVSAAINSFNKALDMSGRLNDLAQATGESAGNLAVLERAFENAGVGGDRVGPMIAKMSNFIAELAKGSDAASSVANKLGISLADLRGKTPTEQLQTLLQAIAAVADETTRMDLSGEVFGNRMGYKLIPLAKNFSAELDNARGELGSLAQILDANSASLDELGDKLKNSVGNKLTELTVGFLAGVQGANNFVDALSKIDAAGAGLDLGRIFSGAIKAPELAFLAIGETLLLYIKKAGNALVEAALFAGEVYRKSFTDPEIFSRIASGFGNALGLWANHFNRILASGIKTILQPLTFLERIFGRGVISGAISQIERLQAGLDASAESMGKALSDALAGGADRMAQIARDTARPNFKLFDEAEQKTQIDSVLNRLRQLGGSFAGRVVPQDSPAMQKLQTELTQLRESTQDSPERRARENELINAMKDLRDGITQAAQKTGGGFNNVPEVSVLKNAALSPFAQVLAGNYFGTGGTFENPFVAPQIPSMPQNVLQPDMANPAAQNSQSALATEATLQVVADAITQLNAKLPQPVLV